jgi:hypothetical protein
MEELIKLLQEAQDQWGAETVKAILKKIDSYPIKDKGTLRRSISYEQNKEGNITFNAADYGEFIDKGVDGLRQSVGSKFKFRGNFKGMAFHLKQWSNSKGLNPYAVAYKIQQRGIKPRPFFTSIIEKRVPDLAEAINKAQTEYLEKSINNINQS